MLDRRQLLGNLTALSFLGGCGIASGNLSSSMANAEVSGVDLKPPSGGVLAVLSYPAQISRDADRLLREAYDKDPLGTVSPPMDSWSEAYDLALLKSGYHAYQLYLELSARLPKGQVLLLPGEVYIKSDGQIGYRVPGHRLPALIRVDFMVYVAPERISGLPTTNSTFGNIFAPLMLMATDPSAVPATHGALGGIDRLPVIEFPSGEQPSLLAQMTRVGKGLKVKRAASRPPAADAYLDIPLVSYRITEGEWTIASKANEGLAAPFRHLLAPYAAMVVERLNNIDAASAMFAQRRFYQTLYDASAINGSLNPYNQRILESFAEAEAKFLSDSYNEAATSLYNGEYGQAMLSRINSERDVSEQAFTNGMIAMLGGMRNANGLPSLSSSLALYSATSQGLEHMYSAHNEALARVTERQQELIIDMKGTSVRASSLESLRSKFKEIYEANKTS
jgi:hypothetical protein